MRLWWLRVIVWVAKVGVEELCEALAGSDDLRGCDLQYPGLGQRRAEGLSAAAGVAIGSRGEGGCTAHPVRDESNIGLCRVYLG